MRYFYSAKKPVPPKGRREINKFVTQVNREIKRDNGVRFRIKQKVVLPNANLELELGKWSVNRNNQLSVPFTFLDLASGSLTLDAEDVVTFQAYDKEGHGLSGYETEHLVEFLLENFDGSKYVFSSNYVHKMVSHPLYKLSNIDEKYLKYMEGDFLEYNPRNWEKWFDIGCFDSAVMVSLEKLGYSPKDKPFEDYVSPNNLPAFYTELGGIAPFDSEEEIFNLIIRSHWESDQKAVLKSLKHPFLKDLFQRQLPETGIADWIDKADNIPNLLDWVEEGCFYIKVLEDLVDLGFKPRDFMDIADSDRYYIFKALYDLNYFTERDVEDLIEKYSH